MGQLRQTAAKVQELRGEVQHLVGELKAATDTVVVLKNEVQDLMGRVSHPTADEGLGCVGSGRQCGWGDVRWGGQGTSDRPVHWSGCG